MEQPVDQQRLKDYQNRVSDWIGKQGAWFQLRYAKTVGSDSIMRHAGGLLIRFLVLLLLVALGALFYLKRHFASDGYEDKMTSQIETVLGADEIDPSGFSRSFSSGGYHSLTVKGGDKSFFYDAVFNKLSSKFSFLTGVTKDWQPSVIRMQSADLTVKAGGFVEEMEASFASIVKSLDGGGLTQITVNELTFDWGYSKLTYGKVSGSEAKAVLQDGRWKVNLSGGEFQQNWLGPVSIDKAVFYVDDRGVEVESLNLLMNGGTLTLGGQIKGPLNMPTFDLSGSFASLPIGDLLVVNNVMTRDYIEGTVSGDLVIGGSSNRGIEMSGRVRLSATDQITMREKWALLRALSFIDVNESYLRVDLTQGGFSFSTGGGQMTISEIDLADKGRIKFSGNLQTRLPTQREAARALGISLTDGFSNGFSLSDTDSSSAQKLEDDRMSLDSLDGEDDLNLGVGEGLEAEEGRMKEEQLTDQERDSLRIKSEMRTYRISGLLNVGIQAVAFDGIRTLDKKFPADESGWRWIPVKIEDSKFATIGDRTKASLLNLAAQAEEDEELED